MTDNEYNNLNKIASKSLYKDGFSEDTIKYSYKIFDRHIVSGSILELGPAEGVMTYYLNRKTSDLTVIEGSKKFSEDLACQFPNITVINTLFEEYKPEKKFNNIILGHVLEHVFDPVSILKKAYNWLENGGRIMAAVPNARSIHRQLAVIMGLIKSEFDMSKLDVHHGHRRVYTPETLRADFMKADFNSIYEGGYWLKPLTNNQLEKTIDNTILNAFMKLGERYPDIAGEIYVIAKK